MVFRDHARIDGQHTGSVRGRGRLELGAGSRLDGDLQSDVVVVGGIVHGDVRVRERACLESTAELYGSLRAPVLEVADGGRIEGHCLTGEAARKTP